MAGTEGKKGKEDMESAVEGIITESISTGKRIKGLKKALKGTMV